MEKPKEYKLQEEETMIVGEPQKNWGGAWTEEKLDAFENFSAKKRNLLAIPSTICNFKRL